MNSNTLRQWLGTLALVAIAVALIVGVGLFATEGAPKPVPATGSIGLRSLSNASNFGSVQVDNDTVAAPGHSYTNDPDTGLYRAAANEIALAAGGTDAFDCTATQCTSVAALASGTALSSGTSTTVGTFMVLTAGTAISPTNGAVITPTASLQPLTSAGTVTVTLAVTNAAGSAYTNGTILRLENLSSTTINIADGTTATLSAAWAAGQYDTLTLIYNATEGAWDEISRSNN